MLTSQQYLPSTEFCDQKKFQATNGDMVSMNFEVVPLPEGQSIRSIVNALQTFVYNIEISMSEAVGDITIREDDDDEKPGASVVQHRLVTKIGSLVQIEANNIAFGEYRPAGAADSEVALLVSDAVDADELFPYRPQTRIRQDMTTIIKLAWSNEGGKSVVVLIRWVCLRIRKSDVCLPPLVVDRIRNGVDKVGEAMLATARHTAAMTN
uniref:START domain-containing protein n=1 Tax=Phytophthora ramorum TaxID=164328 RepID=H3H3D7_PHYRM